MRGAGKKLIYGVGISDDGEFARTYVDEIGKRGMTKEYSLWYHMLTRCYSKKVHSRAPTYTDCCVSDNFKSFQYFAKWVQSQVGFMSSSFQLDKDMLFKGNREYGENTCVFIPTNINNFLVNRGKLRGKFPIGVCMLRGKYFEVRMSNGKGKSNYIGCYKTQEEAFQAYKAAKEAMAKELAIQYEGLVDPRVIVALNNYVVDIND